MHVIIFVFSPFHDRQRREWTSTAFGSHPRRRRRRCRRGAHQLAPLTQPCACCALHAQLRLVCRVDRLAHAFLETLGTPWVRFGVGSVGCWMCSSTADFVCFPVEASGVIWVAEYTAHLEGAMVHIWSDLGAPTCFGHSSNPLRAEQRKHSVVINTLNAL
eukprot:485132-Pleurochrysis_carterae.AAC.2